MSCFWLRCDEKRKASLGAEGALGESHGKESCPAFPYRGSLAIRYSSPASSMSRI